MARVTAADMANEFVSETKRFRGHTYVITELPMKDYDKTVKMATVKDDDTDVETFDNAAHNRLLLAKCVTEDGSTVDVDELYRRGTRIVRQLQRIIQKIHFEDEPEEEIEDVTGEATTGAK